MSYGMTAEVDIPKGGASGVLGTMGGRFGGWVLLLADSKPLFAYAYSNQPQHKYRIASSQALAPGHHTIHLDFKYDGGALGSGGTGTLSVDGKQVAQGRIDHTIRARVALDETMDFGEDTGTPVIEDYVDKMPYRFTGTLDKFIIELSSAR
jgi:arylsulfatase